MLLSNGMLPRCLLPPHSIHLVEVSACEAVQYRFRHGKLRPPLLGTVFAVRHVIFILHALYKLAITGARGERKREYMACYSGSARIH